MGVDARPRLGPFLGLCASSVAAERHGDRDTIDGPCETGRDTGKGSDGIAYVAVGEALRLTLLRGQIPLGNIFSP